MNNTTDDTGREVKRRDTTEYTGSKAPETRPEAEEQTAPSDARLRPGGAHGSSADVGMSGIDRDGTMSGGQSGQERYGDTGKE